MKKSKRVMRRAILCRLFDHLEECYGIDCTRDTFVKGQHSLPQIDAMLSFKSDPRLDELRSALGRLENGTYGICIGCKLEIRQEILDADPGRRLCPSCEKEYSQVIMHEHDASMQYFQ